MNIHESEFLNMLVRQGLKDGEEKAFEEYEGADMNIIRDFQAKEIKKLFDKYIKFPDDEYDLVIDGDT